MKVMVVPTVIDLWEGLNALYSSQISFAAGLPLSSLLQDKEINENKNRAK
jgi:hypothetical protein